MVQWKRQLPSQELTGIEYPLHMVGRIRTIDPSGLNKKVQIKILWMLSAITDTGRRPKSRTAEMWWWWYIRRIWDKFAMQKKQEREE